MATTNALLGISVCGMGKRGRRMGEGGLAVRSPAVGVAVPCAPGHTVPFAPEDTIESLGSLLEGARHCRDQ
jgi:hypothetical protein